MAAANVESVFSGAGKFTLEAKATGAVYLEQADIASREGGALLLTPHARGGVRPPPSTFTTC